MKLTDEQANRFILDNIGLAKKVASGLCRQKWFSMHMSFEDAFSECVLEMTRKVKSERFDPTLGRHEIASYLCRAMHWKVSRAAFNQNLVKRSDGKRRDGKRTLPVYCVPFSAVNSQSEYKKQLYKLEMDDAQKGSKKAEYSDMLDLISPEEKQLFDHLLGRTGPDTTMREFCQKWKIARKTARRIYQAGASKLRRAYRGCF
jgi:hypothetical protein